MINVVTKKYVTAYIVKKVIVKIGHGLDTLPP